MRLLPSLTLLAMLPGSAAARDVKINRDSPALQFEYQWSSEAQAIRPLDRLLRRKAEAAYRAASGFAREDQASAGKDKREFHQHFYGVNWETVGSTPRLLAIVMLAETFSGGAHPNRNYAAILWDRRLIRSIDIGSLFIRQAEFRKLTRAAYCTALDKERLARRNGEVLDGEFGECPPFRDLTIVPRDRNPNGRFETIEFIAAPYTAGPYVEGEYGIDLPVTKRLIAALKPEYRASFEVQRQ